MNRTTVFVGCFLIFLFEACVPELDSIEADWSWVQLPTQTPVEKVYWNEELQEAYAVGGKQFGLGWIANSKDEWQSYSWDSLGENVLLDVISLEDGRVITVGFGGKIYDGHPDTGWELNTGPQFKRLSGICSTGNDSLFVVGGSGLGDGIVHLIDTDGEIYYTQDSFIHEFADIVHLGDGRVALAGYGILMTGKGRKGWVTSNVQGDFYVALSRAQDESLWSVGEFGSILVSYDDGLNWEKIRDGNRLWNADLRFQDIEMLNREFGLVSGKDGICWVTRDGAQTWSRIDGLPNEDYYGIQIVEETGENIRFWIGCSNGRILDLTLDR